MRFGIESCYVRDKSGILMSVGHKYQPIVSLSGLLGQMASRHRKTQLQGHIETGKIQVPLPSAS